MEQQNPQIKTPSSPEPIYIEPQVGKVVIAPKHWYQSRVLWFNVAVIGAILATTATPALEQYMSPESYGLLTAVVGVVNAALRFATSRPIAKTSETPPSE